MPTEQPDPRRDIEVWLEQHFPSFGDATLPRVVRTALAIIDAEHHDRQTVSRVECSCDWEEWPCPRKAEHEARLLKEIRGE